MGQGRQTDQRQTDQGVTGLLDDLADQARSDTRVQVGQVVERLGHRSTGALFLIPGLLGLTPLSGIPGLPTVLALVVLLIAAQVALGRDHLWLPAFLNRRAVSDDKLTGTTDKLRPLGRWLDRHFGGHLEGLTGGAMNRLAAFFCAALAITVPPLELLPFAAALPMGGIAIFGLALLLRDGRLMLGAFALSAVALFGALSAITGQ